MECLENWTKSAGRAIFVLVYLEKEGVVNGPEDESRAPWGLHWSLGKTLASYLFVVNAECFLRTCTDSQIREMLQIEIDRIKLGEVELTDFRNVEGFIEDFFTKDRE